MDRSMIRSPLAMPDPTPSLAAAQAAFDNGRYEACLQMIRHLQSLGIVDEAQAVLAQTAYMRLGELHKALGQANLLRRIAPSPERDIETRRLLGRIIETDPSWLPNLDHIPRENRKEDGDGGPTILHVLKESLPYVETGFTMRSRMTLQAQLLAGFVPEVITSVGFPRTKGIERFPETEVVDGVRHHRIDDPTYEDPRSLPGDVYIALGAELAAPVADRLQPRLIQAGTGYRGYDTALVGLALAQRLDVPFVYEVRGFQEATWTSSPARGERGEYYRRRVEQENRSMHAADAVITIAEAMAEEIVGRGIPSSKVAVVPNAVDTERFSPRPKRQDLIERYGIGDRFVIGYISNLGAREGIEHLIDAVKILSDRGVDVACMIAGDGPRRPKLEEQIAELNLEKHVVLAGHVPNEMIEDYYALIDLFVVPRIEDRAARLVTPLKPLEAMAMGLPMIASDLPALRELVAPGERGEVFSPGDSTALAQLILDLIDNESDRDRYAQSGNKWVKEHRTVQSNADRYASILRPLIGEAQTTT